MSNETFERYYTGAFAAGYDERRTSSQRWQDETTAFEALFSKLDIASVLDCPSGTGRWLPFYLERGLRILALDKSADMLAVARDKVPAGVEGATFAQHDIFEDDLRAYGKFDLGVCIRFVNWISWSKTVVVLSRFSELAPRYFLLGASVVPIDDGLGARVRRRLVLAAANMRRRFARAPLHYVHEESALLGELERLGWTVERRVPVTSFADRVNSFYLLSRA